MLPSPVALRIHHKTKFEQITDPPGEMMNVMDGRDGKKHDERGRGSACTIPPESYTSPDESPPPAQQDDNIFVLIVASK